MPKADRVHVVGVTAERVMRGELYRVVTTRSVWFLVGAELLIVALFSLLVGVPGVQTAVLLAGMLGAVIAGAEYSSGALLMTLVAVGRRGLLFWARVLCAVLAAALPAFVLMVVLVLVRNPYLHFAQDGSGGAIGPLGTGEALLLVCRGAFVLALAGLIGASLAVIAKSVSVAVIILALCFGLGQMLAIMVPTLFSGGQFALIAPDWVNAILPSAVLTRLLGGDFASGTGLLDALPLTVLLALAWCLPFVLWGHHTFVRSSL